MSPRPDIPSSAPAPGGPPDRAGEERAAPARSPEVLGARSASGYSTHAARSAPSTVSRAALAAPPLAAGVLLVLLASFQADRASAAETAYLALWIAAVLLPAAALAPAPAWESTLGAPLAALAVWVLPAGPARSAVVGALLVAALALAAMRALGTTWAVAASRATAAARAIGALPAVGVTRAPGMARTPGAAWTPGTVRAAGTDRPADPGARGYLALTLPLALGAQALLRGDLLLAPGAAEVAALVALPAAGALVLAVLAARCGLPAALLAGATAVILGPGWTAVSTLALAGVALSAEVREARLRVPGAAASPLAMAALGLLLAGGLATETRASAAALAAAAVIVLARPHRRAAGVALLLVLTAAFPVIAAVAPLRPWPEALRLLAWLPILLPALAWAPALSRASWPAIAAAVSLAAAGALAVPGPAAPAAALAALAVLLAERRGSEGERSEAGDASGGVAPLAEGAAPAGAATAAGPPRLEEGLLAAGSAQWVWSAALLAGTALLAAYPWLRRAPAADALALIGLTPGWTAAAVLVALALAIGLGAPAAARRLGGRPHAAWATGIVLGVALLWAQPAPARRALGGEEALGPPRQQLVVELDGSPVRAVAVFSNLSGAAEVAAGTEVASVQLLGAGDEPLARWVLRAGIETGEWAARRPDVAALPELAAPPAWSSWVSAGGGAEEEAAGPFFGQLYRARWTAEPPVPAARLVIERSQALPPGVGLAVHRVEVAP